MFLPNAEVQLGFFFKILGWNKPHTHTLTTVLRVNFVMFTTLIKYEIRPLALYSEQGCYCYFRSPELK